MDGSQYILIIVVEHDTSEEGQVIGHGNACCQYVANSDRALTVGSLQHAHATISINLRASYAYHII